ncbi:MAG: Rho termination factor N-terminal domain-containing protein [Rubrobacteraceae bacterium]|nr:Rho termination factor N-terminal domain-containing protein [Rubrobacteraceae bacterium]
MSTGMLRRRNRNRGTEQPSPSPADLSEKTVEELRELAKARGISGYANMKKAELIEALEGR